MADDPKTTATPDELKVLNAISFGVVDQKSHVIPALHAAWDSAVAKGFIGFAARLTDAGGEALGIEETDE